MALRDNRFQGGAILSRAGMALAVSGFFLWLLQQRLSGLDWAALHSALESLESGAWLGAVLATGVSFWAVGRYDLVLHRHLGTGIAARRAARAGTVAIAISQTLGVGLVTGSLVRWRMLPEMGLMAAARLTLAVTLGFLAGWLAVTSLVLGLVGNGLWQVLGLVGIALCLLGAGMGCHPRAGPLWPNLGTLGRCVWLAAVDLGAAGLALWWLLPDGVGLWAFYPAFLLAFGAGLLSGAPAGLGVFEVTMLALLPGMDAGLLAAMMGWRLVYFALPAGMAGAVALLWPTKPWPGQRRRRRMAAKPAGADLAAHGPLEWRAEGMLLGRTRHCLVALHLGANALRRFAAVARAEGRWPVLYHATGRQAVQARQSGWRVIPVAAEAVLDPARFTTAGSERATLRRKLRKAEAAGVQVIEAAGWRPMAAMEQMARDWALAHGGERGFSIGGWSAERLAGQRVWLAQDGQGLIGFVSFAVGADGWKLDLIRHRSALPDGSLQALMVAALAQAAAEGVPRLSLDHVPDPMGLARGLPGPLGRWIARRMERETAGLRQFKQSFAPIWQPRFLAAPGLASLAVAGLELALALAPRPFPKRRTAVQAAGNVQPMHDLHAESGFALSLAAWQDKPSDCGRV